MDAEFFKLKSELIRLQEIYDSNEIIDESELKTQILASLRELEESLKDFQADFSSNKNELGFLRYHFHKLNSLIHKKLQDEKKWLREQRIYLQYSMFADENLLKKSEIDAEKSDEESSSEADANDSSMDFEMLKENEDQLKNFKSILYENVLKDENLNVIKDKKFFKHFFESCEENNIENNSESKKVDYYIDINNLKQRLDNFIKEDLVTLDEKIKKLKDYFENNPDFDCNNEKYTTAVQNNDSDIQNLNLLQLDVDQSFCFFQKKFILKALNLNNDDFKLQFYDNTENARTAKEKYNKYVLLFHPDKNSFTNKNILTELFMKLTNIKTSIVCKNLKAKNKYDMSGYKEEGLNYFNIASDYYLCSIGNFNLKVLDSNNINTSDLKSNEKLAKFYFEQAYEKFRDACIIADEEKSFEEMLELRILISKCFSKIQTRKLEAQLAAFGCIHLVNKRYPDKYTEEQKEKAQKCLDKIKNKSTDNRIVNSTELNSTQLQLKNGIKLFREFLNVDKNLITIYTDKKFQQHELLKNNIKTGASHITTLVAFAGAAGGIVKAGLAAFSTAELLAQGATLGLSAIFGLGVPFIIPVSLAASGLFALYYSIGFSKQRAKEGNLFKNELKIRQTLDKIIQETVNYFDTQQFKKFFISLNEPFDKQNNMDISLIKFNFEKEIFVIKSKEIIYNMHTHGFKPEAIAYLINMIFEALLAVLFDNELNMYFSKMGVSDSKIKSTIEDLLDSISKKADNTTSDQPNEINLEEEAEKLDNKLRELQSRILIDGENFFGRAKNMWYRFKSYISSQGIIDNEMIKTGKEITFKTRFNEVRNIAKINKIIYFLLVENNETILEKAIKDIQESFEDFHYISKAYLRFEVLKDFIWLFTGDALLKEKLQEDFNDKNNNSTLEKDLGLKHKNLSSDLKILLKNIEFYDDLVNGEKYKFLPIKKMNLWLELKEIYDEARNYKLNKDPDLKGKIDLGYARTCLNLAKYSKVVEFIKSNKTNGSLIKNPEFWLIGSIANRKQFKYELADKFLEQSLNLKPNNIKFSQESDLIQKLKISNPENYIKNRKKFKEQILLEEDYYSKMHNNKKINYNILSIDGGGIRGIIPCVWLNEIEMKTKRPISHLFNMIAGTSTGAIIGSALSLPEIKNSKKPKYFASDILDIYVEKGSQIFSNKKTTLSSFFSSKYSSSYRSSLLESFLFKNYSLVDSLTDLVVPALKKENATKTYIFSSYEANIESRKNFSYYDVLMSTTAAPTYFSPHEIRGNGFFIDGGLTFNDPAELACNEAFRSRGIQDSNLFVLSLGTGSFIPEMNRYTNSDGLFGFALDAENMLFSPQAGDVENSLFNKIGYNFSNYQRWQVFTEYEISLDDYTKKNIDILVDLARQYLEELYISDDNYFNKLLEKLESSNNNELTYN